MSALGGAPSPSFAAEAQPVSPDIATKAELDHLIESRPVPTPEPALTPDRATTVSVNARVEALRVGRESDLRERLGRMRDSFKWDHSFAQVNDRAKADFGRAG